VKARDGPNKGFIFKSSGSSQCDDDCPRNYGGVISAYDETAVRLWAPGKEQEATAPASFIGLFLCLIMGE
jgi:hypothetical protein